MAIEYTSCEHFDDSSMYIGIMPMVDMAKITNSVKLHPDPEDKKDKKSSIITGKAIRQYCEHALKQLEFENKKQKLLQEMFEDPILNERE